MEWSELEVFESVNFGNLSDGECLYERSDTDLVLLIHASAAQAILLLAAPFQLLSLRCAALGPASSLVAPL